MPAAQPVAVLGMGNVLMGDDGAGPYTIAELAARYRFPDTVTVMDIGTPGLDLAPYLIGVDTLILVDTVRADAPAGSIRTYHKHDLLKHPLPPRLSPHDPALGHCLTTLEMAGCAPRETVLVGIVPGKTELGPGLSAPVRSAVPLAVARVVDELAALHIQLEPRTPVASPDIWWETPV